jgi:hypothetical protein
VVATPQYYNCCQNSHTAAGGEQSKYFFLFFLVLATEVDGLMDSGSDEEGTSLGFKLGMVIELMGLVIQTLVLLLPTTTCCSCSNSFFPLITVVLLLLLLFDQPPFSCHISFTIYLFPSSTY